ncbi:PKD domain-containing protein [Arthrobacter sp. CG_A4]|uniref:PKD domain-containing protein n=1 Tax=Arthrobacter sp. CG_A4 TaxID=3071706 RepID=UPI002DF7CE4D|nr:PKD repeat protein [Arthrobacter sp. CG_A4]
MKARAGNFGRSIRCVAAAAVVAVVAAAFSGGAASAADPPPTPLPQTVSGDVLPTPQINGVVWKTAVVGNTAYAVGSFTKARPSGSAAGSNEVIRNNAMAFNVATGAILPWNPNLNAQARSVRLSPDSTKLYLGGDFTAVSGAARAKVAAFDVASGALDPNFKPVVNGPVRDLTVTNSAVFVGGSFGNAGAAVRRNLASFTRATGAILPWSPTTDDMVETLVAAPDGSRIVIGGRFQQLDGAPIVGIGAVDGASGALQPWTSRPIPTRQGAQRSWVTDLSLVGGVVYASANGEGGHWFDGRFAANFDTGDLVWLANCYGASYGVSVMDQVVYSVNHAHDCISVGTFGDHNPQIWKRALAETTFATGTDQGPPGSNMNYAYQPVPTQLPWYPEVNTGNYTGSFQGGWALANNGTYLVMGGEFTTVNGRAQQGLATFAKRSVAPNKVAPAYSPMKPGVLSLNSGTARVAWTGTSDIDDGTLTYEVLRDNGTTPIFSIDAKSPWWALPQLGFTDTGMVPGSSHTYRVRVKDPSGNNYTGSRSDAVVISSATPGAYAQRIIADGAVNYWPLNEPGGSVLFDNASFADADAGFGVTRGASGAIPNDAASAFDGSGAGFAATRGAIPGPDTFTAEAWFKTTSTSGGKILGFGASATGNSGGYDRHIYMDNDGRIWFGVYPGGVQTLSTGNTYNDGQWHQVTASLGADGMRLFIDGVPAGQRSDVTSGQGYSGYWRIGGDNIGGWPNQPASNYFAGAIDDVAIYPTVLTRQTVLAHYTASGRESSLPPAPADPYGIAVTSDQPDLYWRLDESAGTVAVDSTQSQNNGGYQGGIAKGATGVVPGYSGTAAAFDGQDGVIASQNSVTNPTTYSLESWFKTTTTRGGKIIGFGNSNTGLSGNYDRHVYMQDDGTLAFGVWTGQPNLIVSPVAYNDGRWHHMVAEQSSDGMKLYVDGGVVGTNPQTQAQDYSGYWRIGGDTTWNSSSPYFDGILDEVAVYSRTMTADRIAAHYNLAAPANTLPVADFTSSGSNLDLALDAGSSSDPDGQIVDYAWDFGDGQLGSGASANHRYAAASTYAVKLTVTDNRGGTSTVSKDVVITEPPNQVPTADFTTAVSNLKVAVDASASLDPDGSLVAYAWDFGDGHTATGVSAEYTYLNAGKYTVSLTVTDNRGGTSTTSREATAVEPPNALPTASFAPVTQGLDGSFDATASGDTDGQIVGYSWDFGDGSTGTGATAFHSYASAGTYSVALTVTDDRGGQAGMVRDVTVAPTPNRAPTAAYAFTVAGLGVAFDGSESSDPDGAVASYAWDFGDGSAAAVAAPAHNYAAAGTYNATLTVTDDKGARDAMTHAVTVAAAPPPNAAPVASFTTRITGLSGQFDGSASADSDGTIASYAWDFGDGATATGATANHNYVSAAEYSVTLTVSDDQGATSIVVHAVTATAPANAVPVAAFTSQTQNLKVGFDGSGSSDSDGTISTYEWAFGDGTTGTGGVVDHSYATAGDYDVVLTVTDNSGATNSVARRVTAAAAPNNPPVAALTSSATGLQVSFDGSTSADTDGEVTSYAWDFGDGATGTGAVASHRYGKPGTFGVILTATDDKGASSQTTVQLAVTQRTFSQDTFSRIISADFGSADVGGAWTSTASSSNFSVSNGNGNIRMAAPGSGPSIHQRSTLQTDTEIRASARVDRAPTGGGINLSVIGRSIGGQGDYRAKVNLLANGGVTLGIFRVNTAGVGTMVAAESVVPGLSYQVGDVLNLRMQVTGTFPTSVKAMVWKAGTNEPAAWLKMGTDSTAGLQGPGSVGVFSYLSGSATGSPVIASWDNWWAGESAAQ